MQAGPEGGPNSDGCQKPDGEPYSNKTANGCLPCPAQGCLDVISTAAQVENRVVRVRVRCRLAQPCDGALLLLQPDKETAPDGNKAPPSLWIAGSDIRVEPNSTSDVPIKVTPLGLRLAGAAGGYEAVAVVQIKVYGAVGARPGATSQPTVLVSA